MENLHVAAQQVGLRYGHEIIELIHVFFALLEISGPLDGNDSTSSALKSAMHHRLQSRGGAYSQSQRAVRFTQSAIDLVRACGDAPKDAQVIDLMIASKDAEIQDILVEVGVVHDEDDLRNEVQDLDALIADIEMDQGDARGFDCHSDGRGSFDASSSEAYQRVEIRDPQRQSREKPAAGRGREAQEAERAVMCSLRDLSVEAAEGLLDPVIGRDQEIEAMKRTLMRRRKPNILIVAEAGVGKTALVDGLAQAALNDPALNGRPVLEASLSSLVSGARYRGDFEYRMELLVERAQERNAILFIDEIHMLMGAGASAERGMDAANILKPALARGGLSLIGATTPRESEILLDDPALMRRFEILRLREPSLEHMQDIFVNGIAPFVEHHGVIISAAMSSEIIRFCDAYLPNRRFPDKAFDLLEAACISARMAAEHIVSIDHIRQGVWDLGGRLPRPQQPPAEETVSIATSAGKASELVGGRDRQITKILRHMADAARQGRVPALRLDGPVGSGRRAVAKAIASAVSRPFRLIDDDQELSDTGLLRGRLHALLEADGNAIICFAPVSEFSQRVVHDLVHALPACGVLDHAGRSASLRGAVLGILTHGHAVRGAGFTTAAAPATSPDIHGKGLISFRDIAFDLFSAEEAQQAFAVEMRREKQLLRDAGLDHRGIGNLRTVADTQCLVNKTLSEINELARIQANPNQHIGKKFA